MDLIRILRGCLWAMCQPGTFYVLGSGASAGLVRFGSELGDGVIELHNSVGMYPVEQAPHAAKFDRIFPHLRDEDNDFQTELLRNMLPGTLDFLIQGALYRAPDVAAKPQYGIFDVVGAPATIFTYNLDRLAMRHCRRRHLVLPAHGQIDEDWFSDSDRDVWFEAAVGYGVKFPHRGFKVISEPEPEGITLTMPYTLARDALRRAPAMLIVGYSFAKFGDGLDDLHSFNFFATQLRGRRIPIYIIDPIPTTLVERMRDAIKSNLVFGLPLMWDALCPVLIATAHRFCGLEPRTCFHRAKDILRAYGAALDGNQSCCGACADKPSNKAH